MNVDAQNARIIELLTDIRDVLAPDAERERRMQSTFTKVADGRAMTLPMQMQYKAGPASIYPNPMLTPGVTNPQVTQETIATTIAVPGWTATIRPPVNVTSIIKMHLMTRDGLTGNPSQWELDHFISLELGGHPTDLQNLWCQPYRVGIPSGMGAHEKDHVENFLKQQIVSGALTLAEAQRQITEDWYAIYLSIKKLGLLPVMIDYDPDGSSDPDDD